MISSKADNALLTFPFSALGIGGLFSLKQFISQVFYSLSSFLVKIYGGVKPIDQLRLWAKNVDKASKQSQEDVDAMYDHMADTLKILKEHNIKCTLIAGSALGKARHGGIIPWDNDVDLGVLESDVEKIMSMKDYFEEKGVLLVRSDIGIKTGTGQLRVGEGMVKEIDGEYWAIGPDDPFTGVNQDIFTFAIDETTRHAGETVLRYAGPRALATWPSEVLPLEGWKNLVPGSFGGFTVDVLNSKWMNWYLSQCYGPQWQSHDGFGKPIVDFSARWHSKKHRYW